MVVNPAPAAIAQYVQGGVAIRSCLFTNAHMLGSSFPFLFHLLMLRSLCCCSIFSWSHLSPFSSWSLVRHLCFCLACGTCSSFHFFLVAYLSTFSWSLRVHFLCF